MAPPSPNPKHTAEREGELVGSLQDDLIWLGRLAHRLVHDPSLADDAAQDAWLSATSGGHASADRPKLLGTLRSVLFNRRRGERRRKLHEGHASRSEAIPSTADLLIAGERSQILWRHLRGLDEPYRSTLLLRFGQDLDTKAVADHLGVPEDSVRWRIRGGLAQLRESLEREEGPGGLRSLAPLALLRPPAAVTGAAAPKLVAGLGLLVMLKYVAAACVLVIAGVWFAKETHAVDPIAPLPDPGEAALAAAPDGSVSALPSTDATATRTSAPTAAEPGTATKKGAQGAPEAGLAQSRLTGRAIDGDGRPIAGSTITVTHAGDWSRTGATDIGGAFVIVCPVQTTNRVDITIERFPNYVTKTVHVGSSYNCLRAGLTAPIVDIGDVVLVPGGSVTGQVFDEGNNPVPGVTLTAEDQRGAIRGTKGGPVESGPDGSFVLGGLPGGTADLYLRRPGFLTTVLPLNMKPGAPQDLGKIVLHASERLTGSAVDARGLPVPGATVRLIEDDYQPHPGYAETITDERGSFSLTLERPGAQTVIATHGSFRPSLPVDFDPGATVTITLGDPGVPCRFRIVDAITGAPIEPTTFWLKEKHVSHRDPRGSDVRRLARSAGVETSPHSPGVVEVLGLRSIDRYYAYVPGYHSREGRVTNSATRPAGQKIKLKPIVVRSIHGHVVDGGAGVPFAEVEIQGLSVARFGPKNIDEWRALPGVPEAARHVGNTRHRTPRELDPRTVDFLFLEASTVRVRADENGFFRYRTPEFKPVRAVSRLPNGRVATSRVRVAGKRNGNLDLGAALGEGTANIRGRFTGSSSESLAGGHVHLLTDSQPSVPVAPDGTFELQGLIPGMHIFELRSCLAARGLDEFLIAASAGETSTLNVPIDDTHKPILVSLSINGTPQSRFSIYLEDTDQTPFSFASVEDPVEGNSRCALEVGHTYRLSLDNSEGGGLSMVTSGGRILALDGQFITTTTERTLEPGEEHWHFDLDMGSITASIPRSSLPAVTCKAAIRYPDADGHPIAPILAVEEISPQRVTEKPGGPIEVTFPMIPAGISGANLILIDPEDRYSVLRSWPIGAPLRRGESRRLELDN